MLVIYQVTATHVDHPTLLLKHECWGLWLAALKLMGQQCYQVINRLILKERIYLGCVQEERPRRTLKKSAIVIEYRYRKRA